MSDASSPKTTLRLERRLGLVDAVVLGLGSMVGAGVFAAIGPAAASAGSGLFIGLAVAAAIAYANATSSAQLAAAYPQAGGTYVYGRNRLGPFWGFLAGWGFVIGKTASLAAMALTVGAYTVPNYQRVVGVGAVAVMTGVNYFGIRKTATLSKLIVALVLIALGIVVYASIAAPTGSATHFSDLTEGGIRGILESGGLLFFAFAGYARIATLGEEVIDPARTIPRAIPLALGITLFVYATVAVSSLFAVGPDVLARSSAPLVAATEGGLSWASPVVRAGAAVAALGVLLSLLAGVSRTAFAMARNRELPSWLAVVHPKYKTPYRAELSVGLIVGVVATFVDLRGAIGFSSFAVLTYYAITNVAAFTQPYDQRRWPKALQAFGIFGCALLAFFLPVSSIAGGATLLTLGAGAWLIGNHRDWTLRKPSDVGNPP